MAASQRTDYQFVDTPSSMLTCCVCRHVSSDPQLSLCCGYLFCKSCLYNTTMCPMSCDGQFSVVPNKQAHRVIKALVLFCTNKVKGCKWQGPLSELDNHLMSCQFVWVKCTLGCDSMLPKQKLDIHMRDYCPCRPIVCQYCLTTGTHQYITGEHYEQCLNELLPCPNNCEVEGVPRRDIEKHKDVCSLESVECQFHSIGCAELVTRKDIHQHDKEKLCDHLFLTNNEIFKLQNDIEAGVNNIDKSTKEKLDEIEAELNTTQKQLDSLLGGWTVRINVMAATKTSGNVAPVILRLSRFSNSGSVLRRARFQDSGGVLRKRMSEKACYSDPFITHEGGYRMFLKFTTLSVVCVDYSVTLHLLKGPNDDQLSWPLKGKFEVALLNQISDCAHRSTTVIYDSNTPVSKANRVTENVLSGLTRSEGWGNFEFITHHDLHQASPTCQFLKDDCLFFQVCKLE